MLTNVESTRSSAHSDEDLEDPTKLEDRIRLKRRPKSSRRNTIATDKYSSNNNNGEQGLNDSLATGVDGPNPAGSRTLLAITYKED